jgi:predicted house-cleaning noncanonical NTP pyrophosphatase (MazG superfamily)
MALPDTGKLVRDKIPQIIQDSGRQAHVVTISDTDMRAVLEMKLAEETDELLSAPEEARLEELGDIYEVLLALARNIDATEQQLWQTASTKRDERGSFNDRSWLVRTGDA